ncbi:MAG: ABC transporter permease subunit [Eubacteriales bacterium]|jgi:NitT/TauT family transport system permease protein|nr:ABC transporter permease subunit [Eubacteriales bacterium]MDD3197579.1 ABC transporter permease subunit [Eubacteriales bacterium]MDD4683151.1 ABC transporter permease subunit [Eubacteriales bacterium]
MWDKNKKKLQSRFSKIFQESAGRSLRFLFIFLFWIVVWQIAYLIIDRDIVFSSPAQVAGRLIELISIDEFWASTVGSLARIGLGFLAGLAAGVLLAILSVANRWFAALFKPLLSMIRATPVSSFIILALIWMSSVRVVIFIVFLMVMPIIWANLVEGIRKTDRQLLEMARLFKMNRWRRIRLIYLPSISPFLISAVSTSLGLGWKAGIAAEVLSTPDLSLGKSLYESKIYLETQDLFAYTAVIIILSMVLEKLIIKSLYMLQNLISHQGRLYRHNSRHLLSRLSLRKRL